MTKNYSIKTCPYCKKSFKPTNPNHNYCSLPCRFWSKVDIKSIEECWPFKGHAFNHGYGAFKFNGIMSNSHRIAYFLAYGIEPKKLCVLHKCDNPICQNPFHLFLGTKQDNVDDMISKNRDVTLQGENHGCAKLSEKDVIKIRKSLQNKEKGVHLAKKYNVSETTIYAIKKRLSWKHI